MTWAVNATRLKIHSSRLFSEIWSEENDLVALVKCLSVAFVLPCFLKFFSIESLKHCMALTFNNKLVQKLEGMWEINKCLDSYYLLTILAYISEQQRNMGKRAKKCHLLASGEYGIHSHKQFQMLRSSYLHINLRILFRILHLSWGKWSSQDALIILVFTFFSK